ncbi:MAG: hypothetical protein KKI09_16305, partial [Spirochaetes bacterium]|nr:hypothetical protein [Spirochaetota bacterium]MBU0956986.1 hypothetical protein [Spirochaetota bacterium]
TVVEISAAYNSRWQNLLALRQEILQLQAASAARADALAAVNAAGFAETVSAERQGAFDGYLRSGLARAETTAVRLAAAEAGNDWQELDRQYKSYLTLLDQASELLGGLLSDDPDLPDATFRYPTRALTTTTEAQTALQRLANEISAFTARYGAAEDFIASSAAMTLWLQQGAALAADTRTALQTGTSLSARARDQQRLAQSSRLEAELRVNESRAALNRSDFERARERLDRARDAYNASLDYEQNAELRRASDSTLGELAVAILRAENDKVVADTRALITSGRALYLQGEFDRAENVLLQARARWATTNVDPMAEVEYWLRLVQNALAVKSGRDIPVTAPLYPEMSQLLANARKLYDEGRVLLSRDKITALNIFEQAKKNIEQVKLIFPLNQEASLLLLRIMRLIDIGEFNRSAAEKVAAARAKIRDGVNLAEAYADLKDIQSLEPRYPGIQALIEEAEIALGFRPKPPNRADLAESASLLQAAQAIWNSLDTTRFPVAVTQLDRAIELNPDNRQAVSLKDQINTYTGGQATLILPSAADAIYNDAVRLYTRGELPRVRVALVQLYQAYPQANQVQKVINLDAQLTAAGY